MDMDVSLGKREDRMRRRHNAIGNRIAFIKAKWYITFLFFLILGLTVGFLIKDSGTGYVVVAILVIGAAVYDTDSHLRQAHLKAEYLDDDGYWYNIKNGYLSTGPVRQLGSMLVQSLPDETVRSYDLLVIMNLTDDPAGTRSVIAAALEHHVPLSVAFTKSRFVLQSAQVI